VGSLAPGVVLGGGSCACLPHLLLSAITGAERRKVGIVRDPAQTSSTSAGTTGSFNLFDLGRSHSFKDEKTQFIIFVTPQRVRSAADGSQPLRRKFRLKR
jgi:hypothetical protein